MLTRDEEVLELMDEAKKQLAEPGHEDPIIANYDYPIQVNSRTLLNILEELRYWRTKNGGK